MKTSQGGLTDDGSNTILYPSPQRLFKHTFFCWSWQEVGAWWILALLHQRAGKNWSCVAHQQLHHKGQLSARHSPALSYAPTICAGRLVLLLTHRQSRLLRMSHWKVPVALAVSHTCTAVNLPLLCPLVRLTVENVQISKLVSCSSKNSCAVPWHQAQPYLLSLDSFCPRAQPTLNQAFLSCSGHHLLSLNKFTDNSLELKLDHML